MKVLWNGAAIDRLNDEQVGVFFNDSFGIKLDGIAAGFTISQVERSLRDIVNIRSARTSLKIQLIDDTVGNSSCTEGIVRWASENLGHEDVWRSAGPTSLEVFDERKELQWPRPRTIANVANDTLGAIRWYHGTHNDYNIKDLSIINHLGSMNPALSKDQITSAVGFGSLIKQRIRRQLPTNTDNQFVSESRKSPKPTGDDNDLSYLLELLSWNLETSCDGIDSYVFAPKMIKVKESLKSARYCAVSSTVIDPSCFFDANQNSCLWDYELPSYGRKAGNNNGYYLLASETEAILEAVRTNFKEISPEDFQLDDGLLRSILREISGRGFPTLKRMAIQGATSTGEIGMLAALRILQNFSKTKEDSIFPLYKDKHVNLLIPIDPFADMIASLKKRLGMSVSRPDILAVSIEYNHQKISIKFTPIEVKHRSGSLNEKERKLALDQAQEFSEFLNKIQQEAKDEDLWQIAFTNLVVTMVDFGFRAASFARGIGASKEWAEIHSAVLQGIMAGEAEKSIDNRGRLIIIEPSNSNNFDLDKDSFYETLVLKTSDAFEVIVDNGESEKGQKVSITRKVKDFLGNWDLLAAVKQGRAGTDLKNPSPEKDELGLDIQISGTNPDNKRNLRNESTDHEPKKPQGLNENDNIGKENKMGVYLPVGTEITSPFHDPEIHFHPSNTNLNQLNVGIAGDLGTGKTQLTKALIYRLVNSQNENRGIKPKFLIFDYKGDYLDEKFLNRTGGKVIRPHKIPLNLFDISGKTQAKPIIDVASSFNDILGKIYKVDRPNQQYLLKETIKECYGAFDVKQGRYPTIYDIHDSYKSKINGKVDSTLSILSNLVDRELFEPNVSELIGFNKLFDGVTVINLKQLGQDDDSKNMIVTIFLNLFYDYMLKIEKKEVLGEDPSLRAIDSMLLVDEANSIMKYNFDVLMNILLQGREFGVGVLLASQYLSHYRTKNQDYAQPLLTWFIHKVPNITKRELENIGLIDVDTDTIERVKSLNPHECLYKSFDTGKKSLFIRGYPFYKILNGLGLT